MEPEEFVAFMVGMCLVFLIVFGCAKIVENDAAHDKMRRDKIHQLCVKNGNTWIEGTCIPGPAK